MKAAAGLGRKELGGEGISAYGLQAAEIKGKDAHSD
jgi:hypothetical protein